MIIEIRRAGFTNKGAELMLLAAFYKMKERYPEAQFVMEPTDESETQPFGKITQLGFKLKASYWRFGFQWGSLASIIPKRIRARYGLVLDKEIDLVLDAAGFLYSDQWGTGFTEELARSCKIWKKNDTKFIMLPQAFGPFILNDFSSLLKDVTNTASLIFAREQDSYKNLTDIVGKSSLINISNDFTNLIKGTVPTSFDKDNHRVAIVPNCRMIDKTSGKESDAYLPFMIKCTKYLFDKNAKPFILVHEGSADYELAKKISDAVGDVPIIVETNALHIKGILGECDATIGSRFHGLVSALSQGVPSIATGWSHKYHRLFEDYNVKDCVLSVLSDESTIFTTIDRVIDIAPATEMKKTILDSSIQQVAHTEKMWEQVFEVTDSIESKDKK